ncbi:MAG: LmeA family phospholipid-binding protein [Firmicutes bacterium]|nr:LmeA family phospholipid-binding protein [Bacillota bacterium]
MDKRLIGIGFILLFTGFLTSGALFTRALEHEIKSALEQQAPVVEDLALELAPLSVGDFLKGRLGEFSLSARRLGFSEGPVFEELSLHSKGMQLAPGALFFQQRVEIKKLEETHLAFNLSESELTALIRRDLPAFEPVVFLEEGAVMLEGTLSLFGLGRLPFSATASLEKASDYSLRLKPQGLKVGGVTLWAELFANYAQQLTWEFPLAVPWPLRLVNFEVKPGVIKVEWREEEGYQE